MPGANSSTHTMVQHMPKPSTSAPSTPTVTEMTVPFLAALLSSLRSWSSLLSSGGRYFWRIARISAYSLAE